MPKKEQWPPTSGVPGRRRFKRGRSLQWGESPFDDLTRAELLRLVQAYHSALTATRSVLLMHAQESPFWSFEGVGGRALAKANHLMALVGDGRGNEDSEKIYRSFFRTAEVLLFPYLRNDRFGDWGVNKKGEMVAPHKREEGYRAIRWSDVVPVPPSGDRTDPAP